VNVSTLRRSLLDTKVTPDRGTAQPPAVTRMQIQPGDLVRRRQDGGQLQLCVPQVVIDGIFHRTRAGCPWRDLPERFGNWKTVYNRHRRWSGDGTWEKILDALRAGCDQEQGPAWTLAADATIVRAHQHAAGARHEPPRMSRPGAWWWPR
jgi:transposase